MSQLSVNPLKVAALYVAIGTAWIYWSDAAVDALVSDPGMRSLVQHDKGTAFVVATGGIVYLLVRAHTRRMDAEHRRREDAYDQTLAGWAEALDLRDHSTAQHTTRVTTLTEQLARHVGFTGQALVNVRRGATLHDIGKMGVPDTILGKPGPLDDAEWEQMRRHPELAVQFLEHVEYLRDALDIPWCHHERWDGTGYPRGLAGTDIPLSARLFAVIDVYDAVTSKRPYREPMPHTDAMALIRAGAGGHFDPAIVAAFEALMTNIRTPTPECTPRFPLPIR